MLSKLHDHEKATSISTRQLSSVKDDENKLEGVLNFFGWAFRFFACRRVP